MSIIAPAPGGEAVVPLGPLDRGHYVARARPRQGAFVGDWAEAGLYLPEFVPPDATMRQDLLAELAYAEPAGLGAGGEISTPWATLALARTSVRWGRDEAGDLVQLAAHAFAREHDEVGSPLGLRIEPALTYQRVNNALAGAVPGSPGTVPTGWAAPAPAGLTRTLIVDEVAGVPRIGFRYVGAPASDFQCIIQMLPSLTLPAAAGEVWTAGLYLAGSGTGLGQLGWGIWETDGANALMHSTNVAAALPAAWALREKTYTVGAATAYQRLLVYTGIIAAGTVCDFTIYVGGAAFVAASYLPSLYLLGTSPETRAGDVVYTPGGASWFNQAAGTVVVDLDYLGGGVVPFGIACPVGGAYSFDNTLYVSANTSLSLMSLVVRASGVQATPSTMSRPWSFGAGPRMLAFTWGAGNRLRFVTTGQAVTQQTATALPPLSSEFRIGGSTWNPPSGSDSNRAAMLVRALDFYPHDNFDDAALQGLVA